MLLRNSIRAGVAAMAILFTTAFNNNVLAAPIFADGDVVTMRQTDYDSAPMLTTAQPFAAVFPNGLTVGTVGVPNQFWILLTSGQTVQAYLATAGTNTALTTSHFNPTVTYGGQLGGELVALTLNIGFSAGGQLGGTFDLGDLYLYGLASPAIVNDATVASFLSTGNILLGGGAVAGITLDEANTVAAEINAAFLGGVPSAFAQAHLRFARSPTQVPEPATAGLVLLGLLTLGLVRRRSRI